MDDNFVKDFEFDVDKVGDGNLFIIRAETTYECYHMIIYAYNDPFIVYYEFGDAPEDREEFEKKLFKHLAEIEPEYFS